MIFFWAGCRHPRTAMGSMARGGRRVVRFRPPGAPPPHSPPPPPPRFHPKRPDGHGPPCAVPQPASTPSPGSQCIPHPGGSRSKWPRISLTCYKDSHPKNLVPHESADSAEASFVERGGVGAGTGSSKHD